MWNLYKCTCWLISEVILQNARCNNKTYNKKCILTPTFKAVRFPGLHISQEIKCYTSVASAQLLQFFLSVKNVCQVTRAEQRTPENSELCLGYEQVAGSCERGSTKCGVFLD